MKIQNYSRRNFLKMIGVGTTLALQQHSAVFGRNNNDTLKNKPNIIFILTDDQRYDAMSCAGHPWLKTPNMDRLANEGVLFKNAFVTTSLCSPSRGSFLTGCYAHTHEVFRNSGKDPNLSYKTFPQFLQMGGYETAFIGKWHMSREDSPRPGFDHWVSFSGQGRYNKNKINVNGQTVSSETYITDELTNYAVRFLKKDRNKPFMLYLSHKAVHAPFTPAKRHANLYSDIEIESRHNPKDNLSTKPKWGRKMDKNWKSQILNYYRSLVAVDESIGRVYKTLEQVRALDNTVIIFAGDNGYFHGEHGGMWDKRAAYEPSMRIPLIMRYPRLVKPETVCEEMILNIDLAPTILELAGVPIPYTMQGKSWLSVLKGRSGRKSFLYEYFQETDRRFKRPTVIAVRTKQWKYVTYPLDNSLTSELYNLRADPEELDNLVGNPEYADIIDRMKKELALLQKKTGFRYPSMTEL
ncbi:MAG: sulfatase [Planctomycetes bacterium]|nr:sulfatase [Planctomycetota bacterium]